MAFFVERDLYFVYSMNSQYYILANPKSMNDFLQIPFDTTLKPASQIELTDKTGHLEVVVYTYNWWSKFVAVGIIALGMGCILVAISLGLELLSDGGAGRYVSFSIVIGLFIMGIYGIGNAGKLTQNRLEFLMFEDYFTVRQSLFLSQQGQNYAYEDIVSIHQTKALKINTVKQQYTREWGAFLTKAQLEYLEQALRVIWKQHHKSTGAEEDWSSHLIE